MRTMQEMRRTFQIRSQAMNERRRRFRLFCLRDAIGGKKGFGLNEVIGIAAGIIIAVVVVIPGLQGFAGDILENLTDWWNDMASTVFATP
jgi:hypothetical protein